MQEQSSTSTGPTCPKHDDVRTFPPQGDYGVDLICGGFPCQDISVAGKGAGLAGERSGLWNDFARIIRTVRPRWVVIENVPALTARGLGTVLGDLAEIGFDAEWHSIPASAVGAPHRRERIWIVGHAQCYGRPTRRNNYGRHDGRQPHADGQYATQMADAEGISRRPRLRKDDRARQQETWSGSEPCDDGRHVADSKRFGCQAESDGLQHSQAATDRQTDFIGSCGQVPSNADCAGRQHQRRAEPTPAEQFAAERSGWWESEPDVGRVAHGIPSRVDRLRCLGNAVVPQVVEVIGRAILAAEARMTA